MNSPSTHAHCIPLTTLVLALSSVLVACGGGGDSSTSPAAPTPSASTPVTLSGKVFINQAIQNAQVCMDLNANKVCDADEPTSAMTGASGAYSLTYDPANVSADQVAASAIIAQITPSSATTAGSVDAANPTDTASKAAYTLSAPAGKATQINPLTTLVQTGIKAGLTLAMAEASVEMQLAISAADIYDYQGNAPVTTEVVDNARTMALMTASALENGVPLTVIDPATTASATPSIELSSLDYTSASDFVIGTSTSTNIASTSGPSKGQVAWTDTLVGKSAGTPKTHDDLYRRVYLTPSGWGRCDELSATTSSLGMPNRATYCSGGETSVSYTVGSDISGASMATIVTAMQAANENNSNISAITINPSLLGTATFPAGSRLDKRTRLALSQNIFINNTNRDNGQAGGVTTLEAFVAALPSSRVNLGNARGTYGLGLIDNTHALRVAFINTTTAVQFYSCSYAAVTDTVSNCTLSTTGTFAISTVNGVRVMTYSGQPATFMNHARGHAEYLGKVAVIRQNKPQVEPSTSYRQSLNGTAFEAVKAMLPGL